MMFYIGFGIIRGFT